MKIHLRHTVTTVVMIFALLGLVGLTEILPSAAAAPQQSGPISTYPATWTDPCGLPVHGDLTTDNQIPSQSPSMGAPNLSLDQLYSKIVASSTFRTLSNEGHGWVTTYWGLQEVGGFNYSYEIVVAQFVVLSGGLFGVHPTGFATAYYNLDTNELK